MPVKKDPTLAKVAPSLESKFFILGSFDCMEIETMVCHDFLISIFNNFITKVTNLIAQKFSGDFQNENFSL